MNTKRNPENIPEFDRVMRGLVGVTPNEIESEMKYIVSQACPVCGELHDFVFPDLPSQRGSYEVTCPRTNETGIFKPDAAAHELSKRAPDHGSERVLVGNRLK